MKLPIMFSTNQDLSLMQSKWKSILDPVISNLINGGIVLENISLKTGANVINHLLDKKQTGWFIIDQNAAAQIYRSANFNNKTLTLTSNANVTVSLWVF